MTLGYSTPRISALGLSQIKMKKRKNALIRVRPMVTKSFDHLSNEFNSLNTMLRKIKKTRPHDKFFQLVWRELRGHHVTLNTITYCYLLMWSNLILVIFACFVVFTRALLC